MICPSSLYALAALLAAQSVNAAALKARNDMDLSYSTPDCTTTLTLWETDAAADSVYEADCTTLYEPDCTTLYEPECTTLSEEDCTTVYEPDCTTLYEPECTTLSEEECLSEPTLSEDCETYSDQTFYTLKRRADAKPTKQVPPPKPSPNPPKPAPPAPKVVREDVASEDCESFSFSFVPSFSVVPSLSWDCETETLSSWDCETETLAWDCETETLAWETLAWDCETETFSSWETAVSSWDCEETALAEPTGVFEKRDVASSVASTLVSSVVFTSVAPAPSSFFPTPSDNCTESYASLTAVPSAPVAPGRVFGLVAIHSGTPFQNLAIMNDASSRLAFTVGGTTGSDVLFSFVGDSTTMVDQQHMFITVDSTSGEVYHSVSAAAEGFSIVEGYLAYNGSAGFRACPEGGDVYALSVSNCVGGTDIALQVTYI